MAKTVISLLLVMSLFSSAVVTPHAFGRILGIGVANAAPASPASIPTECMPDEAGPDAASAKAIGPHATIAAAICPAGDTDVFQFNASAGDKIVAQLSNLPADYTLCVSGPNLPESCSANPGTNDEVRKVTAAASGNHYVRVFGAKGAYSPKSYLLEVKAGTASPVDPLIDNGPPGQVVLSSTRYQVMEDNPKDLIYAAVVLSGTVTSPPSELDVILSDPATGDAEQVRLLKKPGDFYANDGLPATVSVSTQNDGKLYTERGNLIYVTYTWKGQSNNATGDFALISGGTPSGDFTVKIEPKTMYGLEEYPGRGEGETKRPIAAVSADGYPPVLLGEDMVILDPRSDAELAAFLTRNDGSVVQEREQDDMSVVRVTLGAMSAVDKTDFQVLADWLGMEGEIIFSSDEAHALYNMILFENFDGVRVTFNPLISLYGEPTSPEEPASGADPELDPMDEWWAIDADIQTDRAWTVAALMDVEENPVNLAVIDGGFRTGDDVPALGDGWDYHDDDNNPFGTNPVSCSGDADCPWHGDWVWGAAGAVLNNGANVGGAGGMVAQPMFYRTGYSSWLFDMDDVFRRATLHGADVINFSAGIPCELGGIHYCNPAVRGGLCAAVFFVLPVLMALGPGVTLLLSVFSIGLGVFCFNVFNPESIFGDAAAFAAAHNTVVVAAAGNAVGIGGSSYGPYDVAEVRVVPCILDNVICVGEMASDHTLRNNWGADVDVWGPTGLPRSGDVTNTLGGTSGTTGFISGVVALMKSINRDLTPDEIADIFEETGHAGADTEIHTFVDVYDAVRRAAESDTERSADLSQVRTMCPDLGFDEIADGNDTTALAEVVSTGMGDIGPVEGAALHTFGDDVDWYRYNLPDDVEGRFYHIGWVFSYADRVGEPVHTLFADIDGFLSEPDDYQVWPQTYYSRFTYDTDADDTCYALRGEVTGGTIAADAYEMNNSLPHATELDSWVQVGDNTYQLELWDLTIHEKEDVDMFRLDIPDGARTPTIAPCPIERSGGFNIQLDRPNLHSPIYIGAVYDDSGDPQSVDNSGIEVDLHVHDYYWIRDGFTFEIIGDPIEAERDRYWLYVEYSVPSSEDISRMCNVWEDIRTIIQADIAANGAFRPIPSALDQFGQFRFPFDMPCDPRVCDPPDSLAADWLGFVVQERSNIAIEASMPASSQMSMRMMNLQGQTMGDLQPPIAAQTVNDDEETVRTLWLPDVEPGVYLIKVSDGEFGMQYGLRVYDSTIRMPLILRN